MSLPLRHISINLIFPPILLAVRKPVIILCAYHQLMSLEHYNYNMRFQLLHNATGKQNPIRRPTDFLDLVLRHTPAQQYLTYLKININQLVAKNLGNGQVIRALQHARGLLLLEVVLLVDVPDIAWFVWQLGHIETIKLLSRRAEKFEEEMVSRNKNWKETH